MRKARCQPWRFQSVLDVIKLLPDQRTIGEEPEVFVRCMRDQEVATDERVVFEGIAKAKANGKYKGRSPGRGRRPARSLLWLLVA